MADLIMYPDKDKNKSSSSDMCLEEGIQEGVVGW